MASSAFSSTDALLASATLVAQGAEAKVYKALLHPALGLASSRGFATARPPAEDGTPVFVKHRFRKGYRHPTLDAQLTRARVAGEARALLKCLRAGVRVPALRMVDAPAGVLGIEWIEGRSVRALLGGGEPDEDEDALAPDDESEEDALAAFGISRDAVMDLIGVEIARMHAADVIHGDLTTSNMMLRARRSGGCELFLVDFGLAHTSTLTEDKAVDLYVLERAFGSTHPGAGALFARVLSAYGTQVGAKEWTRVSGRLADVRLRGRKRSMVG